MPFKPIARPAKPVSITEGFNKIKALINRTPTYNGNGDGGRRRNDPYFVTQRGRNWSPNVTRNAASGAAEHVASV